MKFTFTCKKVALNDSIKEYAAEKLMKLERYFREEVEAIVVFAVEKNHRCVAEITIRGGGNMFRAEVESPDGDMRGAIDNAVSAIERQFRKNKSRLSKQLRHDAFPTVVEDDVFDVQEEKEFEIVKTKRFNVKPMSPEEAILQMNLLHHDFFVFRNINDNTLSIVYQRKHGGYGLIETGDEN